LNSDSFFYIGKTHRVCEDYAFAGVNEYGNHIAMVSDGCSSSLDTDFGSRILVREFLSGFNSIEVNNIVEMDDKTIENLIKSHLFKSRYIANELGLDGSSLDATLLCAVANETKVKVITTGDGVVIAKYKNGDICVWDIEYESNAPLYANYLTEESRYEGLRNKFGIKRQVNIYKISDKGMDQFCFANEENIFCIDLKTEQLDYVAVSSDGIKTFEKFDLISTVMNFTSFKSTKGVFVERRLKRFLKECTKNSIQHMDDVSLAAISFGE